MRKYIGLNVFLGIILIVSFLIIENFWPDLKYKILIYIGIILAVLYLLKDFFITNKLSYKTSSIILIIFIAVTVVSQFMFSVLILNTSFFDNNYIIFLGVIYLLVGIRLMYNNKSKQKV